MHMNYTQCTNITEGIEGKNEGRMPSPTYLMHLTKRVGIDARTVLIA